MMKIPLVAALVLLSLDPVPAVAQDTPVVFVHGFNGSRHTWEATAIRLQQELAIRPVVVELPWREHFETQANIVQSGHGHLPATTVAVGHSNGGIVSRQWSRQHPLSGLITAGTPNYGAPIVNNLQYLIQFNNALYDYVGLAGSALGIDPYTWGFVYWFVQSALNFGANVSARTVLGVGVLLGVQGYVPVLPQMAHGSYLLNELNSSWNVAREQAHIPGRVGLAYVAAGYPYAGPMRALDPDNADRYYVEMWASIYTLEYAGAYLWANYPSTTTATVIADSLYTVATFLRWVDPVWCYVVTYDFSCRVWHDGIVPTDYQFLPGANNIVIGGPAHTQEPRDSGAVHYALSAHVGIPARGSGSGVGSGTGGSDELASGQVLYPGQKRTSSDERFELAFQADGNLVLYRTADGTALWATNTYAPDGQTVMQNDGNLVIYNGGGVPLWHTNTFNYPGAHLFVQRDGNVVVYDYYGYPIWATGTVQ